MCVFVFINFFVWLSKIRVELRFFLWRFCEISLGNVFFVVMCFVMPGGCNFYSNGQAAVNLYEPVVSVYSVLDGAYIRHEPAGVDIKQPVAVPADMYPLGHVVSAIVMCSATIVMYPVGHDVDGVAANEPNGASIKDAASIICFIVPSPCLIGYRLKYTCTEIVIANVFFFALRCNCV